ncbi:MAG: type II toxin-antitoxin system HicA family toxin [Planctomycetota bacterium]|nr:type II toxin-antitoxin system HicA family toxin [Planctomycetota bacterium]
MPKLPVISGNQAIRCFGKIGYQVVHQRGSHVRMHHKSDSTRQPLTIPRHKTLGKGLLRKLLRDAQLTIEEFIKLL